MVKKFGIPQHRASLYRQKKILHVDEMLKLMTAMTGDDVNGTDTLAMRRNGNTYFISDRRTYGSHSRRICDSHNSIANPDSDVDTFTFGRASDEVYAGKMEIMIPG